MSEELIMKNEELSGIRFRYRNEEEMKDSGVEWIGKIPKEWENKAIKYLFRLRNERSFKEMHEVQLLSLYTAYGVMKQGEVEARGNKVRTVEDYKEVYPNDIVVNIILAWMGAIGLSEYRGVISPAYDIYEPYNKSIIPKYYHYVFRIGRFSGECYKKGRGIMEMRWRTYSDEFKSIIVPMPSYYEQVKITNFIDEKTAHFDSIISKKEALIERLEEAKKSLISEVVTGKVKVVKSDDGYELVERSKGEMKDSGVDLLGIIPNTWKVTPLKYVAKISGGFAFSSDSFKDEGIQIIKIANLYNNKLSLERQPNFVEESYLKTHKEFIATHGDILISLTGTLGKRDYGYSILIKSSEKFLVNQRVGKITFNDELTTNYGIYVLQSEEYLSKLYSLPSGTKQANLSNEQVLSIRIPLPRIDEQEKIASYLNYKMQRVNRIKDTITDQIEKLKEAKQSLISEAVTGKIEILE